MLFDFTSHFVLLYIYYVLLCLTLSFASILLLLVYTVNVFYLIELLFNFYLFFILAMSPSSGYYSRIKMRFSPGRFKKFVNDLEEDQKGFVQESGFGQLLLLSDFKVSVPLLEWVLSKIIVGVSEFRFQGKLQRKWPLMPYFNIMFW